MHVKKWITKNLHELRINGEETIKIDEIKMDKRVII